MKTIYALMVAFFICATIPTQAQGFLKKVLDATEDKVTDEAADEISDEAAEETENLLNGLFGKKKSEQEESRNSQNEESEEMPSEYEGFDLSGLEEMMGAMDQSANLPPAYTFDFVMDITVSATGEEPTQMFMYFNTNTPGIFGMSTQQEGQEMTFIYDGENSLNVVYTVEDGTKKGVALPDMTAMAASFGSQAMEEEMGDIKITKVGPGKNVAGYPTTKYVGGDDESTGEMYVSNKVPVSWEDSYFGIMQNMSMSYTEEFSKVDGMMLEMHSKDLKTGEESHWVTNSATPKTVTFNNSDYNFSNE